MTLDDFEKRMARLKQLDPDLHEIAAHLWRDTLHRCSRGYARTPSPAEVFGALSSDVATQKKMMQHPRIGKQDDLCDDDQDLRQWP